MSEIKVMIVDDEPLARINLRESLKAHQNWRVVQELAHANDLLEAIKTYPVDVIFLDIQMPGMSGINAARTLVKSRIDCQVVFVTAFDQHAIEAFDLNAVDYILKPFDDRRLHQTLERIEQQRFDANRMLPLQQWSEQSPLRRLLIRSVGSIQVVDLDDVMRFQASGNYIEVHHNAGMALHRMTISSLENQLNPHVFCRIHRSCIVRMSLIQQLITDDEHKHHLLLTDGVTLRLSPQYKERLLNRLSQAE